MKTVLGFHFGVFGAQRQGGFGGFGHWLPHPGLPAIGQLDAVVKAVLGSHLG